MDIRPLWRSGRPVQARHVRPAEP